MGSALAEFISVLFDWFVELVNLTIDTLFLIFYVGALALPWRLPYALSALGNASSRGKFREIAFTQLFVGIFEGLTLAIVPVVLCSGLRTAKALQEDQEKAKEGRDDFSKANVDRCWVWWEQLISLLADLIPFCFLLLAFAMPWRAAMLIRGLASEGAGWLFESICPCAPYKRDADDSVRWRWIGQALFGLVDLATVLPLLLVMATGIRAPKLCKKLRSKDVLSEWDDELQYNWRARGVVWGQFFSLLVDLIFVPVALLVLLSGWRARSLLLVLKGDLKGMPKRCAAIQLLFNVFVDIPFILLEVLASTLAPWRLRLNLAAHKLSDLEMEAADRRELAAEHFGDMILDWPYLIMGILVLALAPWRTALLWRQLKLTDASVDAVDRREHAGRHFGQFVLDLLCALPGLVVLVCCPWRCLLLWRRLKLCGHPEVEGEERRMAALEEFGMFVVDLPHIAMAAAVLVTGWRAPLLWAALKASDDAPSRWEASRLEFLRLCRDIPFIALLPCTLHRLPAVILKLCTKAAMQGTPCLTLSSAEAAVAGNKLRLRLVGTKPPKLSEKQVKVTIVGGELWQRIEETFGGAASLGRALLPMKMVPKFLPSPGLDKGYGAATLDFIVPGAAKPLTKLHTLIRSRCKAEPTFTIQAQCSTPAILLFELHLRLSDLLGLADQWPSANDLEQPLLKPTAAPTPQLAGAAASAAGAGAGAGSAGGAAGGSSSGDEVLKAPLRPLPLDVKAPPYVEPDPLQDRLWVVVGLEFVELLLDVARIIGTVLLLLAPWRLAQLLAFTLEPTKRWPDRLVDRADAFLADEQAHADASLDELSARLVAAARGDETDYPPPEGIRERWRGPPKVVAIRMYVGLEKEKTRKKAIKKLAKLDAPLAELWEKRLANNLALRTCSLVQAEALRCSLFSPHWQEVRYHTGDLLTYQRPGSSFAPVIKTRDRLDLPRRGLMKRAVGRAAAPSAEAPAPAEAAEAEAAAPSEERRIFDRVRSSPELMVRTASALLDALRLEADDLDAQLADARRQRKTRLSPCKLSPASLCTRSSKKARQQVT